MEFASTFKDVIKVQLDAIAIVDTLFKQSYEKPHKNIDDCVKYILDQVQKANVAGWSNDDIFSMAIHYYDEDDIQAPQTAPKCKIVINREVQLTPEETQQAKQEAIERVINEQQSKIRKPSSPLKIKTNKSQEQKPQQLSFF